MRLHRLFVSTLLALSTLILLQSAAIAADFKIAVIDDQKLLTSSKAAQSIGRQIDAKREAFQKEFAGLEQQLRDKEKTLLASKDKMKPEEFNKQRSAFQDQVMEGQKKAQAGRHDLEEAIAGARTQLMGKIAEICKGMSQKNGYNMVITRQTVVLADQSLDITDQVLAQLDKSLTDVPLNFGKK